RQRSRKRPPRLRSARPGNGRVQDDGPGARFREIRHILRRTPFRPAAAHPRRSAQPAAQSRTAVPGRAKADRSRQARLLRRSRVPGPLRPGMKDETMTDTDDAPEWPDPADEAHAVEQAKR